MPTLYIRDVSAEVTATLKERAAARGMSLSAYLAGELTKLASRPTNEELAAVLGAHDRADGPSTEEIVAAVHAGRR